jgi:hypothetical protein
MDYSPAAIGQLVNLVRERSADWKQKAETKSEKATIEVVALMFQSILSEDRLPPSIRVWFARLQSRFCAWPWPSRSSSAISTTRRAS